MRPCVLTSVARLALSEPGVFVLQFLRMNFTMRVSKAGEFIEIEKQQSRAPRAGKGPKKGCQRNGMV
jgi:hypothetical protein